jgi:hypothetical protein
MHIEEVRLTRGQHLLRIDKSIHGETIALARVSSRLHAVYWVSPGGYVEDPAYAGTRTRADGLFESRLLGNC